MVTPGKAPNGCLVFISTTYLPLGDSAEFDQRRFCAEPAAPPVSWIGVFVRRLNDPPITSPPLMIVDPSAETVWHVMVHVVAPGKAGALKSSGAVAPGLMRSTRPRLFDQ